MVDEVREEIKDELRDELRDELKDELKDEFKTDLCQEIATADSPFNALSGMLSLIAIEHDKVNNVMNESIAKSNTRLHEQSEEVLTLKDGITSLGATIDSQNQVIQKLQVRLDDLQTLEEARETAIATQDIPLGQTRITVSDHNANSQETK